MFNSYHVDARMLDGMFSVMLCNNEGNIKKMEDFSCNEQKVEIRIFETDPNAPCQFETNWRDKIMEYCPGCRSLQQLQSNHYG